MTNSVSLVCRSYFEGFQDVSTFNNNNSCKNILGVLKIVSYFTLVMPLFFGLLYGVSSLIGRVTIPESPSSVQQRISSIAQRTFGPNLEQQLKEIFSSPRKAQQLFSIDGSKVGVIFNPRGEALKIGFFTVQDQVVLVSNMEIPEEVSNRITAEIPQGLTHSTVCLGTVNGQSIFTFLGF